MILDMTKRVFTEEHKAKIAEALKRYNANNPEAIEAKRTRTIKLIAEGKMGFAKGNTLRRGVTISADQKAKISSTMIARKVNVGESNGMWRGGKYICLNCGKMLANRKPKNKLCSKCFGLSIRGDKSPNWKGGVTPIHQAFRTSQAYKNWRKAVFERDDYTCVWCGIRGYKLNADHIKSFAEHPELRLELSNGRTLCIDCHKKTPNYARNVKK